MIGLFHKCSSSEAKALEEEPLFGPPTPRLKMARTALLLRKTATPPMKCLLGFYSAVEANAKVRVKTLLNKFLLSLFQIVYLE